MLADVMKQREKERIKMIAYQRSKYNVPIKRDTIVYYSAFHSIGGIETWIYNLGKKYEFTVVYDRANEEQIKKLNDIGIETIWDVGQSIECDTLISCMFGNPDKIIAKKRKLFVHGIYSNPNDIKVMPKYDDIYAVSDVAGKAFEDVFKIKTKTLYNPIDVEIKEKPLIFGVFSRTSKEKGIERVKYLINKLIEKNKLFLMLLFTDKPVEYGAQDDRVIQMKPTSQSTAWISICDYICVLSGTEACPYVPQEALKLGKPLIITRLPILDEFGINDSNAKILEFDMSNLDIDDLWNIPTVKDWKEPISKEWEEIMKKRVFRERYNEPKYTEDPIAKTIEIKAVKKIKEVKNGTKKKASK